MVVSVGLLYYCSAYTGYLSTLDWNGTSPHPEHVGLGNYEAMLRDPVFWLAVQHAVEFYVVTFLVSNFLGLLVAALLHSRTRARAFYKVVIFTPVLVAPAIVAPVFRQQLLGADGWVNVALRGVGLDALAHNWIADSGTAMLSVMAITVWHSTGMAFILYFAALSQIDTEVLEAARIDGAGNARVFRSIILPSVRGTIVALAMLGAIGALKVFDVPYLVTAAGPNHATEFLGTFIYRISVRQAHLGYGAALSIALLLIAVVVALVLNTARTRD